MALRIVFLGSKPIGYQCLQYLLEKSAALDIEVVAVRTRLRKEFNGDGDLAALAGQHQIPLLQSLDEIPECDIIYSVQHHELLQRAHIEKARKIAVNLHLAPLPEYRGCNQFSFAIMDGATEFGATLHAIDTLIDHGDVLFEQRFSIPEHCWVNELYELTFNAAVMLFRDSLKPLLEGNYNRRPQAELRQERPSSLHFREEINELKKIDLSSDAAVIEKTIRATYMPGFEPPYTLIGNKKVYFKVE
jgi:methionyl-tRNA formyltransferase